jgi:type I restriction enzyme S subunit
MDVCRQITDGTHTTPNYIGSGVPFLSVKDISSGRICFDDTRHISREEHAELTKRCRPERDDVLLTKIGTTGFAKAIDTDREFSIFVSLALLKLKRDIVEPEYVQHMLNSTRLRDRSSAGTRGVGNQNLVLKFIREFPMPVPPLEEQRHIVQRLNKLHRLVAEAEQLQSDSAAALSALLPSILDRAFRGEL